MGAFVVTLNHKGKQYSFEDNFDDNIAGKDGVKYLYEEGNYSCDCNRSLLIKQNCDPDFPELPCGDTEIELVKLEFKEVDANV